MSDDKTKQLTPLDAVKMDISRMESEFEKVLPPQIPVARFIRVLHTVVTMTPDLLDCDKRTLFSACLKAASDGLLPDGREGAIVPYRLKGGARVAQWIPMVQGILKKMRNSGELLSINPQVVYEKDDFNYWIDETGEHLKHIPLLKGERGAMHLTYVIAKTKDGGLYLELMTREDIESVKAISKAKDSGPWSGDFESEMWRKTVIRRLSKRMPVSTDVERVIRRDDELYELPPVKEKPALTDGGAGPSRLKGLLIDAEEPPIDVPAAQPTAEEKAAVAVDNMDKGKL